MCVFNDAAYLRAAIDSILGQTYTDFELVIVDDGSTDDSAQIAESYADPRLRLIRNGVNRGLAHALNVGLAATRSELVARHDADDVSAPTRLARQVEFLERHPYLAAAGTQASFIDGAGRPKRALTDRKGETSIEVHWQIMFGSPLFHGSVMFRTHVVRDVFGGYDETMGVGEDYELWSRLMLAGEQLLNLPDVLLRYRVRVDSLSSRYRDPDRERMAQIMAGNIAAYAPIGATADDLKVVAGAVGFGAPVGIRDVRRLVAILVRMRSAFAARFAPSDPGKLDAWAAGILERAAALIYRRNTPAACYALVCAAKLYPALTWRIGRGMLYAALGLSQSLRQRLSRQRATPSS